MGGCARAFAPNGSILAMVAPRPGHPDPGIRSAEHHPPTRLAIRPAPRTGMGRFTPWTYAPTTCASWSARPRRLSTS